MNRGRRIVAVLLMAWTLPVGTLATACATSCLLAGAAMVSPAQAAPDAAPDPSPGEDCPVPGMCLYASTVALSEPPPATDAPGAEVAIALRPGPTSITADPEEPGKPPSVIGSL